MAPLFPGSQLPSGGRPGWWTWAEGRTTTPTQVWASIHDNWDGTPALGGAETPRLLHICGPSHEAMVLGLGFGGEAH